MKTLRIYGRDGAEGYRMVGISYDGDLASQSTLLIAMNVLRARGVVVDDEPMRWDVDRWDTKRWGK